MNENACRYFSDYLGTEMQVIRKHLDEHRYLRRIDNQTEALRSFIADYGWLIREMYCTKICAGRAMCAVAVAMDCHGDLLRNRRATPTP